MLTPFITDFSQEIKMIGAVTFIRVLLLMAGVEPNPGPGNQTFVFRYQYLLIEVGTEVMQKLFDDVIRTDFGTYLAANVTAANKLQWLIGSGKITPAQQNYLPPIDTTPMSVNFDITLLSFLLRNVCGLRHCNDVVWTNPAPTDHSREAYVTRLRECRNHVAHIRTVYMSDKDLADKWTELTEILKRLNSCHSNGVTDLTSKIYQAEHMDIDDKLRKRYDTIVEQWREMERLYDHGLGELKQGQTDIKHDLLALKLGQSQLQKDAQKDRENQEKTMQEIRDTQQAAKLENEIGIIFIVGALIPFNAGSTTTKCVCPTITTRTTSEAPSTAIDASTTTKESTTITPDTSTKTDTTTTMAQTTTKADSTTTKTDSTATTTDSTTTTTDSKTTTTDSTATKTDSTATTTDSTTTTTDSKATKTDPTTTRTESSTTNDPTTTKTDSTTTMDQPTTQTDSTTTETDSTTTMDQPTTQTDSTTTEKDSTTTMDPTTTQTDSTTTMDPTTSQTDSTTTKTDSTTTMDQPTTQTDSTTTETDSTATMDPTTTKTDSTTTMDPTTTQTDSTTTETDSTTTKADTTTIQTDSTTIMDPTTTKADLITTQTDSTTIMDPTTTKADSTTTQTDPTTTQTDSTTTETDSTTTKVSTTITPDSSTATDPTTTKTDSSTIKTSADETAADTMFGNYNVEDECVCLPDLTTPTTDAPTTSELPTTMKTTTATTAPGTIQGPALSTLTISIEFQVSINASFDVKPTYEAWEQAFNKSLYNAFKEITDFKAVIVNSVRPGSVNCDYDLLLRGDANHTVITDELQKIIDSNKIEVDKYPVNMSSMSSPLKEFSSQVGGNACDYYNVPYCEVGYNCMIPEPGNPPVCTPKCLGHTCKNGGICVFNQAANDLTCSCGFDDDYTYSGDTCDVRTEKLALSSTYIIAIAAGAGGAIIIILLIIIIVLAAKRNQSSKSLEKDRFDTLPPLRINSDAEDSWNFERNSGTEGQYVYKDIRSARNSAFVEDTTAYDMELYIQGREHDVYTDDNGSKSFMYPSKQTPASDRPYEDLKRRPKSDYEEIGSSLKDFPTEKVDIPRAQIGSFYNSKF